MKPKGARTVAAKTRVSKVGPVRTTSKQVKVATKITRTPTKKA